MSAVSAMKGSSASHSFQDAATSCGVGLNGFSGMKALGFDWHIATSRQKRASLRGGLAIDSFPCAILCCQRFLAHCYWSSKENSEARSPATSATHLCTISLLISFMVNSLSSSADLHSIANLVIAQVCCKSGGFLPHSTGRDVTVHAGRDAWLHAWVRRCIGMACAGG